MSEMFRNRCVFCLMVSTAGAVAFLLFGGLIGVLGQIGTPLPDFINQLSAYLVLAALIYFAVSAIIAALVHRAA